MRQAHVCASVLACIGTWCAQIYAFICWHVCAYMPKIGLLFVRADAVGCEFKQGSQIVCQQTDKRVKITLIHQPVRENPGEHEQQCIMG